MRKIRIGSGAGYGGDRLEPALEIMQKGNVDYIVFECLAERTIAIAQGQKLKDPEKGYNFLLKYRMDKILDLCVKNKIKVITNMGAANPLAAVKVLKKMAMDKGLKGLKMAAILGDDIVGSISDYMDNDILELDSKLKVLEEKIISASVYLGIDGMVEALKNGSDIVITGRCADPSLFLAPLVYEFGWSPEDYDLIGKGIMIGHLLECGGQITGGYFADPGYKDVPNLWNLGFPIAEVMENGEVIITKVNGTGGVITTGTCKEQLLYEIHDPSSYITPDGISDYTKITMEEIAKNNILIKGATGRKKPDTLKVSIGYRDGFIGEGEISYAGSGAYERAKLAEEVVKKRLEIIGCKYEEIRVDYIGISSLYKDNISDIIFPDKSVSREVRLRIAGRTNSIEDAQKIAREVETLYTNGPAAGGGVTNSVKEVIAIASIFIPRGDVNIKVVYEEV